MLPLRAGGRLNSAPLPLAPESNELPVASTAVVRRAEPPDSETPAHDVGDQINSDGHPATNSRAVSSSPVASNGHPEDNERPADDAKATGNDPHRGSGQPKVDADQSSSEAAHA